MPKARRRPLHMLAYVGWRLLRRFFKMLIWDPFPKIPGFRVEEGTPLSRALRGLCYRLAFLPVFLAATACAIVWVSTHPRSVNAEIDPAGEGIYYEAVTFVGAENARIEGWLIPLLDAKTVLEQKEEVLRKRFPAVVLLHSMGQRREQMLPLVKPLHEAGFIVLAINLRGGGPRATQGETFGLHEAEDVRAAVETLRKHQFVDPARIGLIGCGTGATAALLAAKADPRVAAVVADHPLRDGRDLIERKVMPQQPLVKWLAPLCKWTFEIAYGVKTEDVSIGGFKKLMQSRPVLMFDQNNELPDPSNPTMIEQTIAFLKAKLPEKQAVAEVK